MYFYKKGRNNNFKVVLKGCKGSIGFKKKKKFSFSKVSKKRKKYFEQRLNMQGCRFDREQGFFKRRVEKVGKKSSDRDRGNVNKYVNSGREVIYFLVF